MVNEQLVSYFKEWMTKGYTIEALKSELLRQGYLSEEVDEAASLVAANNSGTSSPPYHLETMNQPTKSEQKKPSASIPKAGLDQIPKKTNDFYKLGAKTGVIAGALQGVIGAIISTVFTTLVFSTFLPTTGGMFGLYGMDASVIAGLGPLAILIGLFEGLISGAIIGAILGIIICILWDPLPGQTPFMKVFVLSIIVSLLIGVLPSLFLGELAIAVIMLPISVGVIGAAIYAYFFDRFIQTPPF